MRTERPRIDNEVRINDINSQATCLRSLGELFRGREPLFLRLSTNPDPIREDGIRITQKKWFTGERVPKAKICIPNQFLIPNWKI
ncbi:hypothetical protein CEXT_663811 [Caerostris extrusa]|uniref:Uncharacterized protein n=1 Tax=Caerostris extrusa TaxID=172846 RepID=A0AAV4M5J3_CAEEX|nr:hypothetical protein CEXT_663811 [Caerostris extrusa]